MKKNKIMIDFFICFFLLWCSVVKRNNHKKGSATICRSCQGGLGNTIFERAERISQEDY